MDLSPTSQISFWQQVNGFQFCVFIFLVPNLVVKEDLCRDRSQESTNCNTSVAIAISFLAFYFCELHQLLAKRLNLTVRKKYPIIWIWSILYFSLFIDFCSKFYSKVHLKYVASHDTSHITQIFITCRNVSPFLEHVLPFCYYFWKVCYQIASSYRYYSRHCVSMW